MERALIAALLLLAACGGEDNLADCDKGQASVPCSERTDDENARLALDAKDYDTAIELLDGLVAAEPTVYARYPLAAAAHAGRAGISVLDLAKAQFSSGGGGGGNGLIDALAGFLPDPAELGDAGYDLALVDVKAAVDLLNGIPAALRAETSGESYASSARLQLTLYQTTYSVMYLNKFAVSATTGAFDPAKLETLTEADALVVLDNLAAVALSQSDNPELKAKVSDALAQIDAADGATKSEKLKEFLKASKAGGATPTTPTDPAAPAPLPEPEPAPAPEPPP